MTEHEIERALIEQLGDLTYTYRPDIRDRSALEANFRQHFEALNRVHLTDNEFHRLPDQIVTPGVDPADNRASYPRLMRLAPWPRRSPIASRPR